MAAHTEDHSCGVAGGGRYILAALLGQGGMATVYRAHDTRTDRDVALKKLRTDGELGQRVNTLELFEREFHTLSQLAHPNVVAAFDYGVDNDEPYYTMELLDGGDLIDRAPMPWRAACALAHNLCSALSLIHSRRLVYRDLSPRNVRCTGDGTAKLIDFGALAAMGPNKLFVGTPAIAAPEAVHLQPLDGRTDLYSLGATLYYALVAQRPFAARTAAQLMELWKSPPVAPSELVAGIPPALDALVAELLQIEAAHRPASAAEVMARLSAIAGLVQDDAALVSRAYVSTPTLIGRDAARARMEKAIEDALAGRGAALLIQGAPGIGRSRMLDACVLAAKVAGALVLRADATDSGAGTHGVARVLARQVLASIPEVGREVASVNQSLLSHVVPEFGVRTTEGTFSAAPLDPVELHKRLQTALRDWFIAVADHKPLVIAVDDVQRVDPQSAAVLALLARAASDHPLLVAMTTNRESSTHDSSLRLITETSRPIRLHRLTDTETESMLRSLFGSVPHVQHVAYRIHAISRGRPREVMQLAQHLVDTGLARYEAGLWSLPRALATDELPASMSQAVGARVAALGRRARELVQAMALAPDLSFSLSECALLAGRVLHGDVVAACTELTAADLVIAIDSQYALSHPGTHMAIIESLDDATRRALHGRVAELFERRPASELRFATHLLGAHEDERAVELLVRHAEASVRETDASPAAFARLMQSIPPNWLELYERGIALCRTRGRPRAHEFAIRVRIAGILALSTLESPAHYAALFEQLTHDAGLDLYAELSELAPLDRLREAFARAVERFAQTPEAERCADPATAIRLLGRMVVGAIGSAGTTLDVELATMLPSLAPLAPLSPALGLIQQMAEGVVARLSGADARSRTIYAAIVERLAQDSAGLDETYRVSIRLGLSYVLGTIEARAGMASSLQHVAEMAQSPLHEVNAVLVTMLHRLWQGDFVEAERSKEQVELLNIERVRPQGSDGSHLPRELAAYAAVDDLTRVKQTLDRIEANAADRRGWQPVRRWARAEYERIRGDFAAAEREVSAAFQAMSSHGHLIWCEVAGAHARILLELREYELLQKLGHAYLDRAEAQNMGIACNMIRLPLALALAKQGAGERAIALVERAIEHCREIDSTGLNSFLAHEARARIAAMSGDAEGFRRHAELCHAQLGACTSGPLASRYHRLVRGLGGQERPTIPEVDPAALGGTLTRTQICGLLQGLPQAARLQRALEVFLQQSGAQRGFLFAVREAELTLVARISDHELTPQVYALARNFLLAELSEDDTTGADEVTGMTSMWTVDACFVYRPVILSRPSSAGIIITGLALLVADADRDLRPSLNAARELADLLVATPDPTDSR